MRCGKDILYDISLVKINPISILGYFLNNFNNESFDGLAVHIHAVNPFKKSRILGAGSFLNFFVFANATSYNRYHQAHILFVYKLRKNKR